MKDKKRIKYFVTLCLLLVNGIAGLTLSACSTEPAGTPDPQEVAEAEGYDLDGFPPTIPHELDARTDCLVCHREGELGKAPKTPHPELVTCRQCHALEEL